MSDKGKALVCAVLTLAVVACLYFYWMAVGI
jgi:hypothetical protein